MTKETTELAVEKKLQLGMSRSDLPEFMRDDAGINDQIGSEFVVPPRIKLVQPTSKPPLSDKYQKGDVCLTPTLAQVAKKGEVFQVVPLFFFAEWLSFNPLEADTFIRERSLDPTSELAMKCRDPERRKEPYEKDPTKFINNVETINFIVAIVGHEELMGMVASVGFSKSEHKIGTGWSSRLKLRGVPYPGTVWELKSAARTNAKGTWFGFDIDPCKEDKGLVMDAEAYAQFKQLNAQFKKLHVESRLQVRVDDDDLSDGAAPNTQDQGEFGG